jgi:hypothetical protein
VQWLFDLRRDPRKVHVKAIINAMARLWRRRHEVPDAKIRDAADQFESAREFLWAQPPGSGLLYPLMNTATVAIELYLKCLSAEKVYTDAGGDWATISSTPSMRGHVLTTLLDNLDSGMEQELDGACQGQLSAFGGLSFRDVLSRCEGAYQEFRYPFEHRQRSVAILASLDFHATPLRT